MHIHSKPTTAVDGLTDGPREAVGEPAPCEKEGLGDRRGIPMSGLAGHLCSCSRSLSWGILMEWVIILSYVVTGIDVSHSRGCCVRTA